MCHIRLLIQFSGCLIKQKFIILYLPFCFKCSETCGVGIQARRLVCSNSKGVTVADGECSNEPRPKLIRSCQNRPCTVWNTSLWSQVRNCVVLIFFVFLSYGKSVYLYSQPKQQLITTFVSILHNFMSIWCYASKLLMGFWFHLSMEC